MLRFYSVTAHSRMKSLKELCMLAILKLGLSRERLPNIVDIEIDQLEHEIVSTFTRDFDSDPFGFYIRWHRGALVLGSRYHLEYEFLSVKSGEFSTLGDLTRGQFALPRQEVTVNDFLVDLEGRKLSLLGTSVAEHGTNPVTINILLDPEWDVLLQIKSVVGNCNPSFSIFYDGFNPHDPDSENPHSEESDMTSDEDVDQQ